MTALCLANGVELAVRFAAAVAGDGIVAVLDPGWPEDVRAGVLERLRAHEGGLAAREFTDLADGPDASTFLIGLTSGTTSVPKGFSRTRRSWRESFERSAPHFGLRADDVTYAPGPMASSLNLYTLAECLYTGTTFRAPRLFTPGSALRDVTDDGATRLVLVPTVLRLVAERGLALGQAAPGVRTIICAGSGLPAETVALARRWAPNAVIHQYYGASELGFVASAAVAGPGSTPGAGPPFPGTRVEIRNDAGRPLPAGAPGTIHVRSGLVSDGYVWGDDGLAFSAAEGWCTVHDRGYLDGTGRLHVIGRESDMIVTGGRNVYPQEVEDALAAAAPGWRVLVTGVPDPVRGQAVVAGVLPIDADTDTDADAGADAGAATALAAFRQAAAALPAHLRPLRYHELAGLPLTPAGKPSRSILAAWLAGAPDESGVHAHRLH